MRQPRFLISKIVCAFILVSTFFPNVDAAVPESFTYQGSLKENGVPVNRTVSIELRLFPVLEGGSHAWSSGPKQVGVIEGLYRMEIPINYLALQRSDHYLETVVNGTVLKPREKFNSAPYALMAKDLAAGAVLALDKGTPTNPSVSFNGDSDTGWWNQFANSMTASVGGAEKFSIYPSELTSQVPFRVRGGTLTAPGYAFTSDKDTGMYHPGTDGYVGFVANGTWRFLVSQHGVYVNHHLLPNYEGPSLGRSGERWGAVWAINGTVQTSASHMKRDIREIVFRPGGLALHPLPSLLQPAKAPAELSKPSAEKVETPRGIVFKWKDGEGKPTDLDVIGFNGDDLPEEAHAIKEDGTRDPDNFYTSAVIGIMAAKIRFLEEQLDAMNKKLEAIDSAPKN